MPLLLADIPLPCASLLPLLGETIKIVIEDYVQHLSGYFLHLKFDPELLFGMQFQYQNRIAVEFNQLYHWHALMPDSFTIQEDEYSYKQFIYNTSMLLDYGVEALVESFSKQMAGQVWHWTRAPVGPRQGTAPVRNLLGEAGYLHSPVGVHVALQCDGASRLCDFKGAWEVARGRSHISWWGQILVWGGCKEQDDS